MTAVSLGPLDLAAGAALVLVDAGLSLLLGLRLGWRLVWVSVRMVAQLLAVGVLLRWVLASGSPAVTAALVLCMALVAAREVAARPAQRLAGRGNAVAGVLAVAVATGLTGALGLLTAIRPDPWWDPRYAVPLAGIILGSVLNAASIALDTVLSGAGRERGTIEARLAAGATFRAAVAALRREAVRRGLMPALNQMSAAGIITLPGIMTGQILAGMDPLEAVKYQMLLMFLLAGASGLGAVVASEAALRRLTDGRDRLRLDRLRSAGIGPAGTG